VDIRAVDSRGAGSQVARNREGDTRVARNRVADSPVADIRVAGMAVDQAIPAAVPVVRQVDSSPANAPDVVAHEPILSTGGAFLNVLPITGA